MSAAIDTVAAAQMQAASVMDRVEERLLSMGSVRAGLGETPEGLPVTHHFTPGLYCREIFMPAGAVVLSKIHRTEHPFVVSRGRCLVYSEYGIWQEIRAPHFGVTKPGARRLLVMLADTVWTTFHVTDKTDPVEIEREIVESRSEVAA